MGWADKEGNIGWQAVGIAPIRNGWSGLIPVPGDGRYEWSGYLPIISKPSVYNPADGIINTSNENVTPNDYKHWNTVSFEWADPYRGDRVYEVLAAGKKHSMADMAALQTDYLSIPARQIVPLYKSLKFSDKKVEAARKFLLDWDFKMSPDSRAAGIFNELSNQLESRVTQVKSNGMSSDAQMKRVIEWLYYPDGDFGREPIKGRDDVLEECLTNTVSILVKKLGSNMDNWQYGQKDYKHVILKHPMSNAVSEKVRAKLDVGPYPRGGNSQTVNNTGSNDNQPSGASFKMIVDTGDWDQCLATNTPGQNGNPDHDHYRNLFELWARDQYFPLFYSKEKIESVVSERWTLKSK